MDCILELEDTGQTAKANRLQLCPSCKRTTKGKGQKKSLKVNKGKHGQIQTNISYVGSIFQTQYLLRQKISV